MAFQPARIICGVVKAAMFKKSSGFVSAQKKQTNFYDNLLTGLLQT